MFTNPVEIVTGILTVVVALTIILLERIRPYTPGVPLLRKGLFTDFVMYGIVQSYLLKILVLDNVILPLDAKYHFSSAHLLYDWPIWAQVAFFVITHDLYIYWFHRAQHTFPVLWRLHEAHHSCKDIDWIAGARSHSLEIVINQSIEFAPMIFLGADYAVVMPIKALLSAAWGMYIHANIDVRSGKLQYVINGPEMHQWHHSDGEPEAYNKNFSTKFAFWDFLFGTAYLPKNKKPKRFGLDYYFPPDWFRQHLYAFRSFNKKKE